MEISEIIKVFKELDDLDFIELTSENYNENILYTLDKAVEDNLLPKYEYFEGASKLVLHFCDTDYVIKIPFSGSLQYTYEDEDDEEGDYNFIEFCGAEGEGWDYCNSEVIRFQWAKNEKVEKCFLETEYICSIDGYPIYIQQLATPYTSLECDNTEFREDELKKTSKICETNYLKCFNVDWLTDVREYYGEAFLIKLLNFVKNYGISDLHNGNLGYIDNRPVIIDYAGYES